jgi:hypothetical protein
MERWVRNPLVYNGITFGMYLAALENLEGGWADHSENIHLNYLLEYQLMTCSCFIIPHDVLIRLGSDTQLSDELRQIFTIALS